MGMIFTNNASGTLNAGILSSDTSFTLQSGQGAVFPLPSTPTDYFFVTFENGSNRELVRCSARSGDVFTVDTGGRGIDGTTAQAWSVGSVVSHRMNAGALTEMKRIVRSQGTQTWL
jgi:hypothetical protein